MARILIIGNSLKSILLFKGDFVKTLVAEGHEVYTSSPDSDDVLEREVVELGATYERVGVNRTGVNPFGDLRYYRGLRRLIRKIMPEVVLSYTHKPVVWGSLAAKAEGVKVISSMIAGLGYGFIGEKTLKQRFVHRVLKFLLKRGLRVNQQVFFLNGDDEREFRRTGILGDDTNVLRLNGCGVNTEHFNLVKREGGGCVFLMVARLLKEKGVREFVEAAREVKGMFPDARFQVLGPLENSPAAVAREDVESWVNEGLIEYLGEVRDVMPVLGQASVFVLPSYREGLSQSIIEAMSMGKAILTTDVPGCRDAVEHGRNGLLVKAKSSEALAKGMRELIESPERILDMGRASRELALEKYDVRKVNRLKIDALLSPLEGFASDDGNTD